MMTYLLKSNSTKALSAALITIGAVAMSLPASADTVKITIDRDDLQSENGVIEVYKQLERKAERACDSQSRMHLAAKRIEKSCTENLIEDFVTDLNHEGIMTYHRRATT